MSCTTKPVFKSIIPVVREPLVPTAPKAAEAKACNGGCANCRRRREGRG